MGSDETATATTGGPRVIAYLTGTGCCRDQIIYFFRWQIGSRARSGIGLGSGSRLGRLRRCLVLSGSKTLGTCTGDRALLSTCTDMYPLIEAPAHAA